MKEILNTILQTEQELTDTNLKAQDDAQELINNARHNITNVEKNYDEAYYKEKEELTDKVHNEALVYEKALRDKMEENKKVIENKLNNNKDEIKNKNL